MTISTTRLRILADRARTYLEESFNRKPEEQERLQGQLFGWEYRWQHTLRVAQFGKLIAEEEGADVELVLAACLLHDVAWFDVESHNACEHAQRSAEIVRPWLLELGYTPEQVENICYSILAHVHIRNPETLEAKVVKDADNIDRLGPYRLLQRCFVHIRNYPDLIRDAENRLTQLEDYQVHPPVLTSTGHQLFSEQLKLQHAFYQALLGEFHLTVLP
ncbi:MAG: HD domain-containing protein [Anaerolineales bacterium]|nr:HD domain-containing protein [Anaerolineales bacterium]MDW8226603.1 HD domain-containing protein [Anaerolineales bacterium]